MAIKNYTSTVPMANSIFRIENRLAQAGAIHITKSYENGRPIGMMFQIQQENIPMTFKLPAKADKVYKWLLRQRKSVPTRTQNETILDQANRTAWKILSDWIDIQVSLIELEQAEPIEIFLPYLYDGKTNQTLFEKAKDNNFKLLTDGK